MRSNPRLLIASVAGAAALSLGVGGALAATSHQSAGRTCKYNLSNSPPAPPTAGTMSGKVKCGKPAGKGKAKFTYTSALAPGKKGVRVTYKGTFKDKFKKGTVKGTFKMSGAVPASGLPLILKGKYTVKRGTKKLRKAHGGGTITCKSTDFTRTFKCTTVQTKGKL